MARQTAHPRPDFTPARARSLYVHFPFCERKCHYCDFYSIAGGDPGSTELFLKALQQEALHTGAFLSPRLETVFFGGGTPSLVAAAQIREALDPVWDKLSAPTLQEWTMEANPSSLTTQSLKGYRQLGINRMSLGVQTLEPELLKKLGRTHTQTQALNALEAVFQAGFKNVSVDLMCGIPGQTINALERTLTQLLSFPITHLSCYLLTLAPDNSLHKDLPTETEQLDHFLWIHHRLASQGFEHYEISNFAHPGHRALHNVNYWQGASYLGLGPSAHSYDAEKAMRWKNLSSLQGYADLMGHQASAVEWVETLSAEQQDMERWMLALRTEEGIPCTWLNSPQRKSWTAKMEKNGLLEPHPLLPGRKHLTPKGFALADQIIAALI